MVAMEQTMPSVLKEKEDVTYIRRCLGVALGKASLVLEETKTRYILSFYLIKRYRLHMKV
jgi:hypothetical protein